MKKKLTDLVDMLRHTYETKCTDRTQFDNFVSKCVNHFSGITCYIGKYGYGVNCITTYENNAYIDKIYKTFEDESTVKISKDFIKKEEKVVKKLKKILA